MYACVHINMFKVNFKELVIYCFFFFFLDVATKIFFYVSSNNKFFPLACDCYVLLQSRVTIPLYSFFFLTDHVFLESELSFASNYNYPRDIQIAYLTYVFLLFLITNFVKKITISNYLYYDNCNLEFIYIY